MASIGTGVVLGSHSVKVVQGRRSGGVLKLTRVANIKLDSRLAERPLDGGKIEELARMLAGAAGGGEAMLGLTGRDLIVRYTHVPPVPDWRLEMLMKFEIEEVSEQSGGEVSADWARLDLPESVSSDNTVLVALAKNTSLYPRIKALKAAGMKLRGACPNAIALYHAFVTTARYEPGEVTLLMHVGAENTDIAIQKDGTLLFARNVAGGGSLFTEAVMSQFGTTHDRAEKMKLQKADVTPKSSAKYEDSMAEKVSNAVLGVTGQFVSMVHSSVMFCKAQAKLSDLSVDRVVLAGGGANLKGFRQYLETNLGMPVVVYDPSGAVDLSGLSPEEAAAFEADPTGLAVPLGLAALSLDRPTVRLEILPEEYRKKRHFMERNIWMFGAAAAAALMVVVLASLYFKNLGAARSDLAKLKDAETQRNQLIRDLTQARTDHEAAERKWVALRDKVAMGPALQRALSMVAGVVGEFRELNITDVSSGTEMWKPRDAEEGVEATEHIKVEFRADVQVLGRNPETVVFEFVSALRDVTGAQPGVYLVDQNIQENKWFRFTLYFAPAEE